jgi:Zn-dependent oligopeptidase
MSLALRLRHPLLDETKLDLDAAHECVARALAGQGLQSITQAMESHARALNRYAALAEAMRAVRTIKAPERAAAQIRATVFRGEEDAGRDTALAQAFVTAVTAYEAKTATPALDAAVRDAWEAVEMALRRRGRRL